MTLKAYNDKEVLALSLYQTTNIYIIKHTTLVLEKELTIFHNPQRFKKLKKKFIEKKLNTNLMF